MRAHHSNTHSYVMWSVGIQSNRIDNNKNANLPARMQLVQCRERPEGTQLGLQVLIHALKIDLERLCLLNIYYPYFLMLLPKIPPPFHAIITSSSNKLHTSMNNHF